MKLNHIERWNFFCFYCWCHFVSIQHLTHSTKEKKNYENGRKCCCFSLRFFFSFVIQDRQCRNDKMSLRNDEAVEAEKKNERKIIPYFDWCLPVNCVNFYIYLILFWKILFPLCCEERKNRSNGRGRDAGMVFSRLNKVMASIENRMLWEGRLF